jgi:iron complex outermembrane recepter protein
MNDEANGWGIYAYANNLFDKVAITSSTATAITVGHTLVTSAAPRTIGVNLRKTF